MTRTETAARKRQLRAERRRAEMLAGGWGRVAQEAAWDAMFPRWRDLLAAISNRTEGEGDWHDLSDEFQRLPRWVRRPWYRLLMQTLHRGHDEAGLAPQFGRWGGYPIR